MKSRRRQSFVFPKEGQYRIQGPLGTWHSVVVHGASMMLESKDGAYGKQNGETYYRGEW